MTQPTQMTQRFAAFYQELRDARVDLQAAREDIRSFEHRLETAHAEIRSLECRLETAHAELQGLRTENQHLRAQVARLQSQPRKPNFPKTGGADQSQDYSSETERRQPRLHQKQATQPELRKRVTREETIQVPRETLPPDAEFKEHVETVIQDLRIDCEVVVYHREKWYSREEGRVYLGALPLGHRGGYGPGVQAFVLHLAQVGNMSQAKILDLVRSLGLVISAGELSNLLTKQLDQFHAEAKDVHQAGLDKSQWAQGDDTSTCVKGEAMVCQVVCNELFSAFWTTHHKDRQTILDLLTPGQPKAFLLNDTAEAFLDGTQLSGVLRAKLRATLPYGIELDEQEVNELLEQRLPKLGVKQQRWIVDALRVAAYQAEVHGPALKLLLTDAAPQFDGITEEHALCWVHEGRHYKKLQPVVLGHQEELAALLTAFWGLYRDLLAYQQAPNPVERTRLEAAFDELVATNVKYPALADRLALTGAHKAELLRVLDHPEVPLHNNASELAARVRVRKRDVSFGPQTATGVQVWDTFMTLSQTARKLGVDFYRYLCDRISQAQQIPPLSDLIHQRAQALNRCSSWAST